MSQKAYLPLILLMISWFIPSVAATQSQATTNDAEAFNVQLELGPVAGLTSTWHPAPKQTGVPVGTVLKMRVRVASQDQVRWHGVDEVSRSRAWSTAELEIATVGTFEVRVEVDRDHSGGSFVETSTFTAIDIAPNQVVIGKIRPRVSPVQIDPGHVNRSTIRYFFSDGSIATLRQVGEDHYRTSIKRWLHLDSTIEPPEIAPLVEWRLDGQPLTPTGVPIRLRVFSPRSFVLDVGPLDAGGPEMALDAYMVRLDSHRVGDEILDGVTETFAASTEPPGFENDITWLASTKHGTSDPVLGSGSTFTVRFENTFGLRDLATGSRRQWLGVKADNAIFSQDRKLGAGESGLAIDPEWGFDPEEEYPTGPRFSGPREVASCEPGFGAIVDPNADANMDGHPDIVALFPEEPGPDVCAVRYCREVRPGEFVEVGQGGPILHPDVPIPLAAIREGCQGGPAPSVCPKLSDGTEPLFCNRVSPRTDCLTVTLCPEEGGWDDPRDPTTRRVARIEDQGRIAPSLRIPPQEVLDPARLLVINPCSWDLDANPSFGIAVGANVQPLGSPDASSCEKDEECRSGLCRQGVCANPYQVEVEQGTDEWNVSLTAGIEKGTVLATGGFYPSLGWEIVTETVFDLAATIHEKAESVFRADLQSRVAACGFDVSFTTRVLDKPVQDIDPQVVIEDVQESRADPVVQTCRELRARLRQAEKNLNEKLHDALIAWTVYRFAGPAGTEIDSRSAAQRFIDDYQGGNGKQGAIREYLDALNDFREAQRNALSHMVEKTVNELEIEFQVPDPPRPGISLGPFSVGLEIQIVGELALEAEVSNVGLDGRPAGECGAEEGSCFRANSVASITPRAAVEALVYHTGFKAGGRFLGVQAGTRGKFGLVDLQLPIVLEFGLTRVTVPLDAPGLEAPFDVIDESLVMPSKAAFGLPFAYGGHMARGGGVGNPELRARIFDGSVGPFVRAWVLFVPLEWSKAVLAWDGLERSWKLGEAREGDLFEFRDNLPASELPNMVTLPRLDLLEPVNPPLSLEEVNRLLDEIFGEGHQESEVGGSWESGGSDSTRCFIPQG